MGVFTWRDGSTYEGFWEGGKKTGVGVFRPTPRVPGALPDVEAPAWPALRAPGEEGEEAAPRSPVGSPTSVDGPLDSPAAAAARRHHLDLLAPGERGVPAVEEARATPRSVHAQLSATLPALLHIPIAPPITATTRRHCMLALLTSMRAVPTAPCRWPSRPRSRRRCRRRCRRRPPRRRPRRAGGVCVRVRRGQASARGGAEHAGSGAHLWPQQGGVPAAVPPGLACTLCSMPYVLPSGSAIVRIDSQGLLTLEQPPRGKQGRQHPSHAGGSGEAAAAASRPAAPGAHGRDHLQGPPLL